MLIFDKPPYLFKKSLKGLLAKNICEKKVDGLCNNYIIINNEIDWKIVRFPWYNKYDINLPAEGVFPFIPPKNWMNRKNLKGDKNGYLDKDNNEWIWGTHHNKHWDVQLARKGKYKRVSPEGKII